MQIEMPQLGETVAEGTITVWHKAVGDRVAAGDALFDVETDKASMEVPSISAGVLTEIRVNAGEVAPVGAVVGIIAGENAAREPAQVPQSTAGTQSASAPAANLATAKQAPAARSQAALATQRPARQMTPFTEVVSPARGYGPARLANGVSVTPYARRLAAELNVPLAHIKTGNSQRITASAVLAQPRGEAVGARVELAVRHLVLALRHRHRPRIPRRLRLHPLVDALRARVRPRHPARPENAS